MLGVRMIGLGMLTACTLSCSPAVDETLKGDATQVAAFECPSAFAAARKSGVPAPVLILLEPDPWAMVIGSDSPAFALYQDGQAIYRTRGGYKSVRLSPKKQKKFLESLRLGELSRLAGGYRATEWTDQPQTFLLFYGGDRPVFISVYGSWEEESVRARLPSEIAALRDKLRAFEDGRASQWLPDNIEVMIWPYEYAPEPSIAWPNRWPGLDAPTTRRRGEDSFSLYVPSADYGPLTTFLASRRPRGAVEIGGKKWAASLRLPFPHEALWMAPKGC